MDCGAGDAVGALQAVLGGRWREGQTVHVCAGCGLIGVIIGVIYLIRNKVHDKVRYELMFPELAQASQIPHLLPTLGVWSARDNNAVGWMLSSARVCIEPRANRGVAYSLVLAHSREDLPDDSY